MKAFYFMIFAIVFGLGLRFAYNSSGVTSTRPILVEPIKVEQPLPTIEPKVEHADGRQFAVGDCVSMEPDPEAWDERPPVRKIVEIGKVSYRTHFMFKHGESQIDSSLRFHDEQYYHTVECPK